MTYTKLSRLFIFLIAVSFLNTSCSNDETGIGTAQVGEIRAQINQNTFSALGASAQAFLFNDILTIVGTDSIRGELLTITAGNVTSASTFDLSGNNNTTNAIYTLNDEVPFASTAPEGGGILNIETLDIDNQILSGDFEFTGTRPGEPDEEGNETNESQFVANGSFTALELQFTIPNDPNNSFTALVDGVDFIPTAVQARTITVGTITSISIIALDIENEQSISLSFPIDTTGNQSFDSFPDLGSITGQYTPDINAENPTVFNASGNLNITNNNQETQSISGTFQFDGSDFSGQDETVFMITAGSFSIFY